MDSLASVSMMDLSIEAEAFGSTIRVCDDEVPTVIGHIVSTPEEADALKVPERGAGRTQVYIDSIEKACRLITDRPVFSGTIGPFSLAGRLLDVSYAMIYCYEEPEMVHTVLKKSTDFIIDYIKAYKEVGADGVVIAEPLAGLLNPELNEEFSVPYMKRIVEETQDENFLVVYHNCGGSAIKLVDAICTMGVKAFHFGNAINMEEMMQVCPPEFVCFGNISPSEHFLNGTPESVKAATTELLSKCSKYPNFVISSGCDIPPMSSWDNIDAFFEAVSEYYKNN